ncbi:MAG: transketolase, partial [Pseudonocardia sp.]|nr:transketolase [Pseudonocardia sp.]
MRALTIDAVEAAKSGHPGAALALAPVGHTLWNDVLRYDVDDPQWPNRDRFVLSVGHASMLLYTLLHLARVKSAPGSSDPAVSLRDIERFRQLDSVCAGHPEHGLTPGVECTTGPLSTGAATSVGMAIAGKWLAARYNKPGLTMFDFDVYALAGDGCMMEGLSQEAASLAGHLRLDNLCWIYDSNRVTIEGPADLAFSDDVAARFRSYGWRVLEVGSAEDTDSVRAALHLFRHEKSRAKAQPTLIIVESVIGIGAPTKQGTSAAHSEPLGDEEGRAAKRFYGWPEDDVFTLPDAAYQRFADGIGARGRRLRAEWDATAQRFASAYPDLSNELTLIGRGELPEGWDADLPEFAADTGPIAGRLANQQVMNALAPRIPWLIGGASDLAPSTKTRLTFDTAGDFQSSNRQGRNLHYGVREALAAAAANGMALTGLRPFQSGFLVFSDFQRAPLRLSALMKQPVVHIYTHDSISMGEDGPTHQPVEHLASLRAMPGLVDLRPADANEIAAAWRVALAQSSRP